MSFAYIQGREVEALAFFESKLSVTTDASDRKDLEALIRKLREDIKNTKQANIEAITFANSPVCFG